jgi:hypothetical protein
MEIDGRSDGKRESSDGCDEMDRQMKRKLFLLPCCLCVYLGRLNPLPTGKRSPLPADLCEDVMAV